MSDSVTRGSDNVFADLGFENPDEELLKTQIALRIRTLIKQQGLTQAKAGGILNVAQPDVSSIVNGRIAGFSLERLLGFVRLLGDEVEITIRHPDSTRGSGRIRLRVA